MAIENRRYPNDSDAILELLVINDCGIYSSSQTLLVNALLGWKSK
jgi:hypothetical protein